MLTKLACLLTYLLTFFYFFFSSLSLPLPLFHPPPLPPILQLAISTLSSQLAIEKTVSSASTKFLAKRQDALRAQLGEWEVKYEQDLNEMTATFNKLTTARDDNLKLLTHLQHRRSQELAKERAEVEAKEAEIAAAKEAEVNKVRMDTAANVIAAVGRAFLKRMKEKGKGGKKEKKGKKGKKGKK